MNTKLNNNLIFLTYKRGLKIWHYIIVNKMTKTFKDYYNDPEFAKRHREYTKVKVP